MNVSMARGTYGNLQYVIVVAVYFCYFNTFIDCDINLANCEYMTCWNCCGILIVLREPLLRFTHFCGSSESSKRLIDLYNRVSVVSERWTMLKLLPQGTYHTPVHIESKEDSFRILHWNLHWITISGRRAIQLIVSFDTRRTFDYFSAYLQSQCHRQCCPPNLLEKKERKSNKSVGQFALTTRNKRTPKCIDK